MGRMDELGSLIPSRRKEKTKEPYLGTYHYSTSATSKKIRTVVKAGFTDAFASLPLGRDDELRILAVGCGLGFVSCVSAEFYKNARITGIDTFNHASLKRSSLERAKENARILGFSDRRVTCLGISCLADCSRKVASKCSERNRSIDVRGDKTVHS